MSARVISSAQTFIHKFILPLVVAGVLAYGFSHAGSRVLPILVQAGLLLGASIYWFYIRLKNASLGRVKSC